MPKRIGNLYSLVYAINNIDLADEKAGLGRGSTYGVVRYRKKKEEHRDRLINSLVNLDYHTSKYSTFMVYEPKEREIFRLPYFPDRITHHALMNILLPIWEKIFIRNSYSCIPNRGIHMALKDICNDMKHNTYGTKYCLKMDIKKFYPSINHDILKLIIRKKLKDKDLLAILDEIIDSADGVPIGNYLSLYFANLYLTYFDHWLKETKKVKYYYRYADDMVILSSNKEELHLLRVEILEYLENKLKLNLKRNWQVFPVEVRGIDFVGYVIRHRGVRLRKSIKKRMFRTFNKFGKTYTKPEEIEARVNAYAGWLRYCNSYNLCSKIFLKYNILIDNWNGEKIQLRKFRNKTIFVKGIRVHRSYFELKFTYLKKRYTAITKNRKLYDALINHNGIFPVKLNLYDRKTKKFKKEAKKDS